MGRKTHPPGTRELVTALALDGQPKKRIARLYGVDPTTVARWAEDVQGLNVEHVAALKRALPSLLTILATAHTLEALKRAAEDPATAVKSTFGAKLAVEAGRGSEPQAATPGENILTFIRTLPARPPRQLASEAAGKGPTIALEEGAATPLQALPTVLERNEP